VYVNVLSVDVRAEAHALSLFREDSERKKKQKTTKKRDSKEVGGGGLENEVGIAASSSHEVARK
jgi:hypothetical protein